MNIAFSFLLLFFLSVNSLSRANQFVSGGENPQTAQDCVGDCIEEPNPALPFSTLISSKSLCELGYPSSNVCKSVDKKDIIDCKNLEKPIHLDAVDFLAGCTTGLFNSVKDLIGFVWTV